MEDPPDSLTAWLFDDFYYGIWSPIKQYLDSGSTKDLPESVTKALVVRVEGASQVTPLTSYDTLLAGTTATGLILLFSPTPWAPVVGGAVFLASLVNSYQRNKLKLLTGAGATLAFAFTNPIAAATLAAGAAAAAVETGKTAVEVATTVVGALVTASGMVVGYLVVRAVDFPGRKKIKRKTDG